MLPLDRQIRGGDLDLAIQTEQILELLDGGQAICQFAHILLKCILFRI
jgi:hypothetical protein